MKRIALLAVAFLMVSCGSSNSDAFNELATKYMALENEYSTLKAEHEKLKEEYKVLENTKETPVVVNQNSCCGEAARLKQAMKKSQTLLAKLRNDFNDYQSGFGIINVIDIDNRIKALERELR